MRITIILILFLPSIALGGDIKFKGDYKTNEIRSLWMTCHQSVQKHMKNDPVSNWMLCDCFLDSLRSEVGYSDFKKLDESKQYEITFRLTTNCWAGIQNNRLT